MTGRKIAYARVSTDDQDLTAQRAALAALGMAAERVHVDHGLTGHEPRPAGPARGNGRLPCREHRRGDKPRPARPVPARRRGVVEELTTRQVKPSMGRSVHGKQPKLSPKQEAHLVDLYRAAGHTMSELEELVTIIGSEATTAEALLDAGLQEVPVGAQGVRVGTPARGWVCPMTKLCAPHT